MSVVAFRKKKKRSSVLNLKTVSMGKAKRRKEKTKSTRLRGKRCAVDWTEERHLIRWLLKNLRGLT